VRLWAEHGTHPSIIESKTGQNALGVCEGAWHGWSLRHSAVARMLTTALGGGHLTLATLLRRLLSRYCPSMDGQWPLSSHGELFVEIDSAHLLAFDHCAAYRQWSLSLH
jgi:hypothetical protein